MMSSTWLSLKTVVFVVTAEAGLARVLDRGDGDLPEARVVADVVVDLAHAVEVDDEGEARVRLKTGRYSCELSVVRRRSMFFRSSSIPATTS